ncbi:MAG: fatty acid desaturase [Thiomonas sp.]|uniref:DesA family fatty acid desaturase n=1 Tax=Thiomonas sp. TaxID=2047785 RepID=UPI002A36D7FB|nr:fatty acid desaturase [Thiomonas sp.]MDY0329606.1 fatty acid desaturase [Thiomonas sp.]
MFDVFLTWAAQGFLRASWWQIVLFALITTHITIASVTIFLHRAQAHRALELHPAASHFFRFWLWFSTGMVTKEWVAIHRKHHARCETVDDPHSPVTRGIDTVLLRGAELYRTESKNAETLSKFGRGTPDDWLERNVYSRFAWQGVGLLLILDVLMFGAIGATVWAVQMLWIPIWAAGVINGLGHWWGYRNFSVRDRSHNILPWGLLIGGEELHNNHHTYPTSAKLSVKWWEFDIGWAYIRALSLVGLAKPRKLPPQFRLGEVRAEVDQFTLQAVIANRYEVMARYATGLKSTLKVELARAAEQGTASNLPALRAARRWIAVEREILCERTRALVDAAANASPNLGKLLRMREELKAVWEQTNLNAEQLRLKLQDWCHRAEDSGVAALKELSLRMRRYAPAEV